MDYNASGKPHWLLGHYYGDIVRKLFFAGAIVMLLSIPLKQDILPFNFFAVVIAALVLTLLTGFTNPRQRVSVVALAFLLFENNALQTLTSRWAREIPPSLSKNSWRLIF